MRPAKANIIFVTGATGNQGGAVAWHLLQRGFHVKALTRTAGSAKARKLQEQNVELVEGDLNEPASYRDQLKGAYGVFSVQTFAHGVDREVRQGIQLANQAAEIGVTHFVYSSVAGADRRTGVPHWDSKLQIEDRVRQLAMPHSIIRPTALFENFLIPQVKSRIAANKLSSPLHANTVQQLLAADDVGRLVAEMFAQPDKYLGKTITPAAEELTTQQIAALFSETLKRLIVHQKLPMLVVRLFMGKALYKMFDYINSNDCRFVDDVEGFKRDYPGMTSLRSWIAQHFQV